MKELRKSDMKFFTFFILFSSDEKHFQTFSDNEKKETQTFTRSHHRVLNNFLSAFLFFFFIPLQKHTHKSGNLFQTYVLPYIQSVTYLSGEWCIEIFFQTTHFWELYFFGEASRKDLWNTNFKSTGDFSSSVA